MTLEEWDRKVAPFLTAIEIRARQVQNDAYQILEWVKLLPAAPDFETRAIEELNNALNSLGEAGVLLVEVIDQYNEKEKVK